MSLIWEEALDSPLRVAFSPIPGLFTSLIGYFFQSAIVDSNRQVLPFSLDRMQFEQ